VLLRSGKQHRAAIGGPALSRGLKIQPLTL
jgi:hypothetical protein